MERWCAAHCQSAEGRSRSHARSRSSQCVHSSSEAAGRVCVSYFPFSGKHIHIWKDSKKDPALLLRRKRIITMVIQRQHQPGWQLKPVLRSQLRNSLYNDSLQLELRGQHVPMLALILFITGSSEWRTSSKFQLQPALGFIKIKLTTKLNTNFAAFFNLYTMVLLQFP